ncbi:hypothetical protein J2X55_000881 [Microbacterium sp. 1154]|uniref:DUF262 domain-containing protein n=1 Tax=Microbacterium sp. 1154 TaxID=2817733 RepID=UPI0028566DA6|nr:DUF262 domain-containing protein [Microbacterium sp. 1154]MDR6689982.1 hypothetical protein [Microbacterium sp. 1154]
MADAQDSDFLLEESIPLVPGQGEDEADLDDPPSTFVASVSSKDWTVETLVSQMRKGRIDLAPSFQRRNAWLGSRKSKLIESIMLQFPIPQIVLAEEPHRPGHFFVLDGKQRLLALRQFFVRKEEDRDEKFEGLRLTGLEVLPELNRLTIAGLEEKRPDLIATIENHSIRTVVLGDWNSERMLLSLFLRLNTGSVPLSPQELRQALIHGDFIKWLDRSSGDSLALQQLLNNRNPDRRMVDAELLLRHLAFSRSPVTYRGNLKSFLDDTSRLFNRDWDVQERQLDIALQEFEHGVIAGMTAFGADAFARKWTTGDGKPPRFERALNRAVFDVQGFSFAIPRVRDAIVSRADDVLQEFKLLSGTNDAFIRSISATTKTADAFTTRHRAWRDAVQRVTGVTYDLPAPLLRA